MSTRNFVINDGELSSKIGLNRGSLSEVMLGSVKLRFNEKQTPQINKFEKLSNYESNNENKSNERYTTDL